MRSIALTDLVRLQMDRQQTLNWRMSHECTGLPRNVRLSKHWTLQQHYITFNKELLVRLVSFHPSIHCRIVGGSSQSKLTLEEENKVPQNTVFEARKVAGSATYKPPVRSVWFFFSVYSFPLVKMSSPNTTQCTFRTEVIALSLFIPIGP